MRRKKRNMFVGFIYLRKLAGARVCFSIRIRGYLNAKSFGCFNRKKYYVFIVRKSNKNIFYSEIIHP